ncbi:MAG: hypothetical protein JW849_07545 [Phycisphaerae bacterium]|nr:hypothetical protein [Phycisphaerae bacterium]
MRRIVLVCCFIALCAGIVFAGISASPAKVYGNNETSHPVAQTEAGAGFLVELSTMGLLGVGLGIGAVSLIVSRKRKHS